MIHFFYDIPKPTHESFIYESKNYLGYPFSVGKGEIVEELEKQLSFYSRTNRLNRKTPSNLP